MNNSTYIRVTRPPALDESGGTDVTSSPVRIPADVEMTDRILGPLTARQLAILAVAGSMLYCAWRTTSAFVPLPVFLALAIPVAVAAMMLALGQRDGVSLDRLLLAAIQQGLGPRHSIAAPEGIRSAPTWLATNAANRGNRRRAAGEEVSPSALALPAEAVTGTGVVDLGGDGLAVIAACSTVNFGLRTPQEQEALVACFGRYLHSLTTSPVQVLVHTSRLDLSGQVAELREQAVTLPHPALETAAVEHADYLAQLGEQAELLARHVLLILREPTGAPVAVDGLGGPGPLATLSALARRRRRRAMASDRERRSSESRLVRRLSEATELLAPAGIVVTALDAGQATAVLAAACNPDTLLPPTADLAGADEVITSGDAGRDDLSDWDYDDSAEGGQW